MSKPLAAEGIQKTKLVGIALVNIATLTWATNMALARWLRHDIGPLTLAACRFSVASLLFYLLLRRRAGEERRLGRDRWLLAAMGLTGVVVFAPVLYLGLRFTTTANATLINGFGPIITGLLAAVIIREPMTRRQVAGALVALVGVVALIAGGTPGVWGQAGFNPGDLIMVAAVALWGLYSVLGRQAMRHRSALSATALPMFLGLPLLLLAAAFELRSIPVDLRLELVVALLYIGIFPTIVGTLAWNEGVRRLGASGAMVFYNTLPLYGALLGFLFLGESFGVAYLIGGSLIIGGGLHAARSR